MIVRSQVLIQKFELRIPLTEDEESDTSADHRRSRSSIAGIAIRVTHRDAQLVSRLRRSLLAFRTESESDKGQFVFCCPKIGNKLISIMNFSTVKFMVERPSRP